MKSYLIHHLLTETALKLPEKIAFKFEDTEISYQVLEEKSGRLANLLIKSGVRPGDPVGVYLSKSLEAIISCFAVLKTGGIYIPLDTAYSPTDRIAGIIRSSETKHIITTQKLWEDINEVLSREYRSIEGLTVVLADSMINGSDGIMNSGSGEPPDQLIVYDDSFDSNVTGSNKMIDTDLAYILYTSGSTGIPKGVMISHLNALTFINWAISYFKPGGEEIFANHAPLNFDLSVFDIYVSVASGNTTCLVPPYTAANPRALLEWMANNKISYWYSVPQVWITILNYAEIKKENLTYLKNILFAGEVFPTIYLKKLMTHLPDSSYYNLYGPTETNVCTCYHVKSREFVKDRPVPIGKACENTRIIVLNENGKEVGVGEEGELFVKGSGVTAGYYRDPEKTASAFMESPLSGPKAGMLYKTGDIVLKCDDNNYEYIGRKDLMVKCSGFRIELPEIELAIYQYEGVEEAVAVSHFDEKKGTSLLYAFVTQKHGQSLSILQLKKYLANLLPKYMVPDMIEKVAEIPINANGKTDRQKIKTWIDV